MIFLLEGLRLQVGFQGISAAAPTYAQYWCVEAAKGWGGSDISTS